MSHTARVPDRYRRASRAIPVISALVIVVVWQVAASAGLEQARVLAAPLSIVQGLVTDSGLYLNAVSRTAWVAARGWFFGNLVAIVLALLFVHFAAVENLLLKLAVTLFCLPVVALMPILQLTFDADTARVALAGLSVFFTTLVAMVLGLRSADRGSLTLVRAWGGGDISATWWVRARSALPSLIGGLQVAAPAAVLGAVFGEFIGGTTGLGVILINGMGSLDPVRVWSVALLATLLAAVPYLALGGVGGVFNGWSTGLTPQPPVAPARQRGWGTRAAIATAWAVGSVAVVIAFWFAYLRIFDVSAYVGKSPIDVWVYLTDPESGAGRTSTLLGALATTLMHAGIGYAAGLVVGTAIAVVFLRAPAAEWAFSPLTIALRSVPLVVMTPLLILVFGRGLGGVTAITTIVTFFPTLATMLAALRRTPVDALTLLRSYDASFGVTLWRVHLPFALPSLFAAARVAAPTAVLAATLAEWLATGDGLGSLIATSRSHSDYVALWAGAALLTTASLISYSLVTSLERFTLARFSPSGT
ncbi:MAG: transporter permease subunit [Microbacterium sp.]|jgi:ABC-type nitrate/sulfonate/bicarbonate transport system permease component|nr:transporter permease subunit [Microbacterium sp.]